MGQSLVEVYLHVIFSTKDRRQFLTDKDLRSRLHAYLAGACNRMDCPAIAMGATDDHIHMLCRLGKTTAISPFLRDLKREATKWIKQESPHHDTFQWQSGYGAFSVSPSHLTELQRYIANQEDHHQQESFQDELRRICNKYGVHLDELVGWG